MPGREHDPYTDRSGGRQTSVHAADLSRFGPILYSPKTGTLNETSSVHLNFYLTNLISLGFSI